MYQKHNFHPLKYRWPCTVVCVLKVICLKRNLLFMDSGCWPRMASLKRWSASVTLRSLAGSGREGTMRTASASTTQKWPARSPSSPGQTDRIPGLVASEWNCDNLSVISGLFQLDWENADQKQAVSLSQLVTMRTLRSVSDVPNHDTYCPENVFMLMFFHPHLIVNRGLKSENEFCHGVCQHKRIKRYNISFMEKLR